MTTSGTYSRYQFSYSQQDDDGRIFLDARPRFRYRAYQDNIFHVVQHGESLWSIAGKHFETFERGAGLWWLIGDFQPVPIHDPTIQLAVGSVIILPSARVVMSHIFSPDRRPEPVL